MDPHKPVQLHYWHYRSLYRWGFDTVDDAVNFAVYGLLENGDGSPDHVTENGRVVLDRDALWARVEQVQDQTE